jgi:hypothetical protein
MKNNLSFHHPCSLSKTVSYFIGTGLILSIFKTNILLTVLSKRKSKSECLLLTNLI